MRPTPIHHWDLPGVPAGFQVWVKRDDMTGSTLSGNKVGGAVPQWQQGGWGTTLRGTRWVGLYLQCM